jgi:hypothetical protein
VPSRDYGIPERSINSLARWVPRVRAEVAGTHWHDWRWWHHFRLPALALNIPPRIAMAGLDVGLDFVGDSDFRVGAYRRVRPHGNASLS